ncbi:phage minor capsid protein [Anaerobacillus sp. CMMVII]|uniref:phage minor capsid protein n=1 Tax=Anaerobacillus sp. CMMVII TaxID=2755588 RepID=UPI0021B79EF8|nr:phage minor capsid protein [Anaerobacillus sp. CMMVII]MCT8138635.1 phage minor capsid protein [Anaerobacillus sp. CMMVII]
MGLPPDKLQRLSSPVAAIYSEVEEQLLINIAKKLAKDQDVFESNISEWQFLKLSELNALNRENIRTIAKNAGRAESELISLLSKAGFEGLEEQEKILRKGLELGELTIRPGTPQKSTALLGILQTYTDQAKDKFNLINSTILSQSDQVARDIINRTTANVLAGVSTPQVALRRTLSEWSEKGIPALVDAKGRQWSSEAYVSMITRTMTNQVTNEMQNKRIQEYGVDLIEISSHVGARPRCALYQGRIYSLSGWHPKYPAFSTTSYGEPAGLFGINCGHQQYPFWEGMSRPTFEPYDEKENARVYELSQKQRQYERDIRTAKRRVSVLSAAGDEVGAQRAKNLVSDRQARMRLFINDTDRTRKYDRELIG